MATYEWRCTRTNCGHVFETQQKYEDPPPVCPKCKSEAERLISRTSFVLKGGGWSSSGYSGGSR